ncbi:hypothetical protein MCERE19_00293 [Spirosomataceae bacterium]|jgi:hypothetical protein
MKFILGVFFMLVIFSSCKKTDTKFDFNQIKEESASVKPGYAQVVVNIDNQPFYEDKSFFKTTVFELTDNVIKISLLDSNKSNVILDIQNAGFKDKKEKEFIKLGSDDYTRPESIQLMIGKLIKLDNAFKAEGFMFENGKIKIEYFSEELVIISINGFVIIPGKASIQENFIPIKGFLAIKPNSKIP